MQVEAVINAAAGTVRLQPQHVFQTRLQAALQAQGWDCRPHWVAPDGVDEAVRAAAGRGAEMVLVGGGDGTLNAAANVLAGSPVSVGVLPLGTFNHLARDLGVPADLEDAVAALAAGADRWIDLGEVNGRYFVNNCSLGLYPAAVRRRNLFRQQLGLPKPAAMGYALLGALWRLPRLAMTMTIDDAQRPLDLRAPFLFVGNNRYRLVNPGLGQRDCLDGGALHVAYVRQRRLLALLRLCLASVLGHARELPDLIELQCARLRLGGRPRRLKIAVDGEVIGVHLPLTVQLRSRALKVRAPCV